MPSASALVSTYLNDHLAAATAAVELARRAAGQNEDSELGAFLSRLASEIGSDRDSLKEIMDALGVGTDRVKVAAGWLGEKAGRLKLNGRWFSYSPLSALVEVEALTIGIHGKLGLWRALLELDDERIPEAKLGELVGRAEAQLDEIERYRLDTARWALNSS